MDQLPRMLAGVDGFQWDAGNSSKNWKRHRVTQGETEQVFLNQPLLLAEDARHSATEPRYFALGRSDFGRLLSVAFTIRGTRVRVISARPMSRRERDTYVEAEEA